MALADTASLIVDLSLKGNFARGLGKVSRDLNTFDRRLGQTETRAFRFGQQIGTGIRRSAALAAGGLAFLATQIGFGLNSLVELEAQTAQTNAVIKSTGGIAGITADEVGKLAEQYENLNATIGDEVIRSSENLLLTFTNVRKKAFEPALLAILDMNTALGRGEGGLQQTTLQVGKALQDPVKGITALRRAGVNFTAAQVKKIKSLIKEGKLYQAQGVILRELQKEFGGSFLAGGGTTAGKVAKFRDAIEDLQRTLAAGLLPVVSNVADALSKTLADPAVIADVTNLGKGLASLFSKENLATGAKALGDFFREARAAAPGIIAGAKIAGEVVATAVKLFQGLPPEIQRLAIGAFAINKLTGGLVTTLAGGLISSVLKQLVSGVVNVQGGVVNVVGAGVPGAPGVVPGGGKGGILGKGGGVLTGISRLLVVGMVAEFATELGPEISGLGAELGQTWREVLKERTGIAIPTINGSDIEWPFGPKNAPKVLTEVFGPGGLFGTTPTPAPKPVNQSGLPPGHDLTQTQFLDKLQATKDSIEGLKPTLDETAGRVRQAVETTGDMTRIAIDRVPTSIEAGAASVAFAQSETTRETTRGVTATEAVRNATATGASNVVSAIYANRPSIAVNVHVQATQVTKTVTIQERYGPGNGSAGTPAHDLG